MDRHPPAPEWFDPDLRGSGNNDRITSLRVQFNPATYFRIVNATNGLALDSGGDVASGADLKQWTWDGSSNLQWRITHRGGDRYSIANRTTGLVLDGGGNVASGSVTKQWTYGSSTNLLWSFTAE